MHGEFYIDFKVVSYELKGKPIEGKLIKISVYNKFHNQTIYILNQFLMNIYLKFNKLWVRCSISVR